jgi:plastocyanin domain-containing protein
MKKFVWMLLPLGLVSLEATGCQNAGRQDVVAITVTDRGFEPADVRVAAGQPITLEFTRKTDQTCATDVVFQDGQRHELPLNQPVRVTLPASQAGTLDYACGMNMIKGKVTVQ